MFFNHLNDEHKIYFVSWKISLFEVYFIFQKLVNNKKIYYFYYYFILFYCCSVSDYIHMIWCCLLLLVGGPVAVKLESLRCFSFLCSHLQDNLSIQFFPSVLVPLASDNQVSMQIIITFSDCNGICGLFEVLGFRKAVS